MTTRDRSGRPVVTAAQIGAAVIAGVPILSNLAAAFGVFTPSPAEQHALTEALTWATGFAGLLVVGDAHLRSQRNAADAKVEAAHAAAAAAPAQHSSGDTQTLAKVGDSAHFDIPVRAEEPLPRGAAVMASPTDGAVAARDLHASDAEPDVEPDDDDPDPPLRAVFDARLDDPDYAVDDGPERLDRHVDLRDDADREAQA